MSYWPFLHDSMLIYLMIHVSFDTNVLRIDADYWQFDTEYDKVLKPLSSVVQCSRNRTKIVTDSRDRTVMMDHRRWNNATIDRTTNNITTSRISSNREETEESQVDEVVVEEEEDNTTTITVTIISSRTEIWGRVESFRPAS